MEKKTYDELAQISAITGIPIDELERAYNSLAAQYDPIDKLLDWLERKLTKIERWWKNEG